MPRVPRAGRIVGEADCAEPPNPLMQPTNAGAARRRPRPSLPAATMDRRLSQGRLQLICLSLGGQRQDLALQASLRRCGMRFALGSVLLALVACSDPGPDLVAPLDGFYSGGDQTYGEVSLTLTTTGGAVLGGTLLLRDTSDSTVFDGPVSGTRVGASGFEVGGGRAPSVGGGTVSVQGTRTATGLRITVTSSWLPSTTLTLSESGRL